MAQEWFIKNASTERGPYSASEMKQLAKTGRITPDMLVRKGVGGNWIPAARVKGLFDRPMDPEQSSQPAAPPEPMSEPTTSRQSPVVRPSSSGTYSAVSVPSSAPLVETPPANNMASVVPTDTGGPTRAASMFKKDALNNPLVWGLSGTVVLLLCVIIFMAGRNSAPPVTSAATQQPASQAVTTDNGVIVPKESVAQPPKASIRREVFEPALRAALEFTPGQQKIQLTTELELIEHSVQGETESMAYKFLKEVEELETDLQTLEVARRFTEEGARQYRALDPGARAVGRASMPAQVAEMEALETIANSGGAAVSSKLSPKLMSLTDRLLDRNPWIKPQILQEVRWIPYEDTQSKLRAGEKAILQTVGELMK